MQRILFLCLIGISILIGFLGVNQTHWLKLETRHTITVSLIYKDSVEKLELEPYTTVGEVLEGRDYPDMDHQRLNPERILAHKDVLNIPIQKEIALISINTANQEELMELKGVGAKMALAIIEDREKNGPYQNLEDLKRVKGMGNKKFESIYPHICL